MRETMNISETAVTVSLDGVMTPTKGGARSAKREAAFAAGLHTKGPAGLELP